MAGLDLLVSGAEAAGVTVAFWRCSAFCGHSCDKTQETPEGLHMTEADEAEHDEMEHVMCVA